jgi:hypothetical protein
MKLPYLGFWVRAAPKCVGARGTGPVNSQEATNMVVLWAKKDLKSLIPASGLSEAWYMGPGEKQKTQTLVGLVWLGMKNP